MRVVVPEYPTLSLKSPVLFLRTCPEFGTQSLSEWQRFQRQ